MQLTTLMKYCQENNLSYYSIVSYVKRKKQLNNQSDISNSDKKKINNADMTFGTVTDEDGDTVPLTHGNYIAFMESHDRQVRKAAFTNMYEAYKGLINTICAALMTLVTALYVGLGLALDLWRTAWWVFAVGGILCAVVNIVLDPYRNED